MSGDTFQKNFREYISKAIKDNTLELECGFKNCGRVEFGRVISALRGIKDNDGSPMFEMKSDSSVLDISMISSKKWGGYRMSISGEEAIMSHCRTGFVDQSSSTVIQKSIVHDKLSDPEFMIDYRLKRESLIDNSSIYKEVSLKNMKFYRYKKRYSFTRDLVPLRVDLTLVKTSKGSDIVSSGLFDNNQTYEIEVEFDNSKKHSVDFVYKGFNDMKLIILRSMFNNKYVVGKTLSDKVRGEYIDAIKMDKKKLHHKNTRKYFIGPKIVSLETYHIEKINKDYSYAVTDKADGERSLLFISLDKKAYIINDRLDIIGTGAECSDPKYYGAILDGEIISNSDGTKFYSFDAYIRENNQECIDENLKTRMQIVEDVIKRLTIDKKGGTKIYKKNMLFPTNNATLGDLSVQLFNKGEIDYQIDGLIYTPINAPVGSFIGGKPIPLQNIGNTWYHTYKWKPLNMLTIDFMVEFNNNNNNNNFSDDGSPVVSVGLYVSGSNVIDNPIDVVKKIFSKDIDINTDNAYGAQLFTTAFLKSTNKGIIVTEETKEPVISFTVVEFRYDTLQKQWIPVRNRHDKTAILKKTKNISNTANNYIVAQKIWSSILKPITLEMLQDPNKLKGVVSIDNEINEINEVEGYYVKSTLGTLQNMRMFHNRIKGLLIKDAAKNIRKGSDFIAWDISIGQGGDILKYMHSKYSIVIGTDISKSDLTKRNGAYWRYREIQAKHPLNERIPMIFFESSFSKEWNREYMESLQPPYNNIGLHVHGYERSEDISITLFDIKGKKVDVIYSMFSIHYAFQSDEGIRNFFKNVNSFLNPNTGKLIGTFLDGDKVLEIMEKKKVTSLGYPDQNLWKIEKNQENTLFNVFVASIGTETQEPIINLSKIQKFAKEVDLHLEESKSFNEYEFKSGDAKNKMSQHEREFSQLQRTFVFSYK